MEEEIKKEFEAKSKPKKIDIKALEESRKEKVRQSAEGQQKDFRHLLKRADQPRSKKGAGTKSGEKRRSKSDSDGQSQRSKHLSRSPEKKPHTLSQGAAELTGSWDYIPSPPTSTVDLLASHQQDEERWGGGGGGRTEGEGGGGGGGGERIEVRADYHLENEADGAYQQHDSSDDIVASAPTLNPQEAANFNPKMDWDSNIRTSGTRRVHQDFDYETQF